MEIIKNTIIALISFRSTFAHQYCIGSTLNFKLNFNVLVIIFKPLL